MPIAATGTAAAAAAAAYATERCRKLRRVTNHADSASDTATEPDAHAVDDRATAAANATCNDSIAIDGDNGADDGASVSGVAVWCASRITDNQQTKDRDNGNAHANDDRVRTLDRRNVRSIAVALPLTPTLTLTSRL